MNIANTRKKLQEVASYTLLFVQAQKLDVNVKKITDIILRSLFKLGALKESCGKAKKETYEPLGDVTVRMEVSIQVVNVLWTTSITFKPTHLFQILVYISIWKESDEIRIENINTII